MIAVTLIVVILAVYTVAALLLPPAPNHDDPQDTDYRGPRPSRPPRPEEESTDAPPD